VKREKEEEKKKAQELNTIPEGTISEAPKIVPIGGSDWIRAARRPKPLRTTLKKKREGRAASP